MLVLGWTSDVLQHLEWWGQGLWIIRFRGMKWPMACLPQSKCLRDDCSGFSWRPAVGPQLMEILRSGSSRQKDLAVAEVISGLCQAQQVG